MKNRTKILILFLTLILFSCKGIAQETETKTEFDFSKIEKIKETKLKGKIINDYDSIFNSTQRKELLDILYNYNIKTTRQIVIVTIDSIKPYFDIQKYTTDLGKYWGVGTAEKDNGMIILLCKPCGQIQIATGTGTQQILTDEVCKEVIEKTIIPEFKNGNFYIGVKKGVTHLIEKWK